MGDLNAGPGSRPLRELFARGHLLDAWHAADTRLTTEYGTYARYRSPRPGKRIDWIAVSPDVRVERIGINPASIDGGWPSDHLLVQAAVVLPQNGVSVR
nr:endonuclease/exonuclease/phosphatase family protein [Kocuria coralli]